MAGMYAMVGFASDFDRWANKRGYRRYGTSEARDEAGNRYLLIGRRDQVMGIDWTDYVVLSPNINGLGRILDEIDARKRS